MHLRETFSASNPLIDLPDEVCDSADAFTMFKNEELATLGMPMIVEDSPVAIIEGDHLTPSPTFSLPYTPPSSPCSQNDTSTLHYESGAPGMDSIPALQVVSFLQDPSLTSVAQSPSPKVMKNPDLSSTYALPPPQTKIDTTALAQFAVSQLMNSEFLPDLTALDKQKQRRERNKEHARRSRNRQRAYKKELEEKVRVLTRRNKHLELRCLALTRHTAEVSRYIVRVDNDPTLKRSRQNVDLHVGTNGLVTSTSRPDASDFISDVVSAVISQPHHRMMCESK